MSTVGTVAVALPTDKIADFCQKWRIVELALFGSVLRDDFRPDSDIDLLVTFEKGARRGLFDLVAMEDELTALLGRDVDLVTKAAVEASPNWIRRRAILSSAEPIYVAR
jgi:predicted nucleotidyltransferase